MNVLMLGWELPPHNSGGLGVACYYLTKELAKKKVSIDFIVPYKDNHPNIDYMNIFHATSYTNLNMYGCGPYCHEVNNIIKFNSNFHVDGCPDIRSVQAEYVDYVKQFVKYRKPDVIHAHDWLTVEAGIEAKKLTGAPLILHIHATEFDRSGGHFGNKIIHDIEYNGLKAADKIITVSNITKQIIVKNYKINPNKITVIHNAIDQASFYKYENFESDSYRYFKWLKQRGYKVVLAVTRFTIQKGLANLVRAEAMASLAQPKLVFLFVGDGEQKKDLIELSTSLGIADRTFFTGFVRGQNLHDAYKIGDIFVMSSISEPFGLTALEAAHYKNALIVTKQSGVSEVLSSIFKYDFWDVNKLARQIVAIAESPLLEEHLGQCAKNESAKYTWENAVDGCLTLYRQAIKESKNA